MRDVLEILIPWIVTTCAIFALIGQDERRLSPAMLARAWPATTKLSALIAFGFLAVPVHFWRTRRGLRGVAIGFAWGAAALLLDLGIEALIDAVP